MTQGTPWKVIFAFMFPIFAGLLLQQLYNTVDTLVVGNFAGEAPLAAVGGLWCSDNGVLVSRSK